MDYAAWAWTVKLRQGVEFHRGFGEVTGRDVAHTFQRYLEEGSTHPNFGYWHDTLDRIEVINDYQVVFHLKRIEPEWYHPVSSYWGMGIASKAQHDQEGDEGYAARPAATGPYQFVERRLGSNVLWERVPYTHWRVQSDFEEIEYLFAREDLSRLAMLLTGDVHIAEDIPLDVQQQAIDRGMQLVRSTIPAGGYMGQLGGNYHPSKPHYDPNIPWAAPGEAGRKVRAALNHAINRQELVDAIFLGRFEPIIAPYLHHTHPEYDPRYEAEFEANLGYDPEKARRLLREAGYPQGFRAVMQLQAQVGAPRQDDVAEAVATYWQAIGVDVTIEVVEQATSVSEFRGQTKHGKAWVQMAVYRPPWNRIGIFNTMAGIVHGFESELIEQKWAELGQTIDPSRRVAIQHEIIDHLLYEYGHYPLVWVFNEYMVNPSVVAEWVTLGVLGASDLEYAKAAR